MQYDPFRSSRDLGLTWPEVKLWPWPFKVIVYMVRRALTRQTRWYQNRCSTFKNKDFIVEKPFWKILEFWPLETSILSWAKKWPKWFRNDFSQAFERCLLFFSTATRSRDHGGGVQTPPQQAVENPEPQQGAGLRPAGGCLNTPCDFSRIARKGRRAAPPNFHLPYPYLFGNFCESVDPGSCKVRSPSQVQWLHHTKPLQSRPSDSVWEKVMKLSEYDQVIGTYKMYISDLWYISP